MSNFLSYGLLVFINAFVTVVLGIAFQFSAFTETSFFVCLFLFMHLGSSVSVFSVWDGNALSCILDHNICQTNSSCHSHWHIRLCYWIAFHQFRIW